MRLLAALVAVSALSACASSPDGACPPPGAPCPVLKGAAPSATPPACRCETDGPAVLAPIPDGFQPWSDGHEAPLRFVVGDELRITLPFYEDENVTATVAPDGNIYVGLLGAIRAVDRTPGALAQDLERRYSAFLRFPEVGVVPTDFGNRTVFVGGEVDAPGAIVLRGPTGVLEAIFEAGGFEETAHREQVVLIRRGPRGPMMRLLDLDGFANGTMPQENTLLQPFDIVVVPKSPIAKINLFVRQYIEGVIPFNQNFTYVLGTISD